MSADAGLEGAVLVRRTDRGYLWIRGSARTAFLHRLLTSDVAGQAPGTHAPSLLLDTRGRIAAALDLWMTEEAVLVGTSASRAAEVVETLRRFVLRDDVTVETAELAGASLLGDDAPDVVDAHLGASPEVDISPLAEGGYVLRSALPGFEIVAPAATVEQILERLLAGPPPLHEGDASTLDTRRIEAGIVAVGAELTGAEFPQELRLEAAVDFEKGCYLGQETVARIHYRGHVNRLLCGLRLQEPCSVGATVADADDKEVGGVTSVATSARFGPIALAVLRREVAAPGTPLRVGGADARVVSLPFQGEIEAHREE